MSCFAANILGFIRSIWIRIRTHVLPYEEMEKKRVVVVGGGVAGSFVAKALELDTSVTLVDPKDFFEIPYAALRSTVEPSFAEKSIVSYTDFLTETKLVQSEATSVSESEVTTNTGECIAYDYLVVCTGAFGKGALTRKERIQQFKDDNERLKGAKSVLIVGGGPVGVELAGEIAVDLPDKKVTLVHNSSRLIEFLGPAASNKALKWLKSKSIEVILNERVPTDCSPPTYTTDSGKKIEADTHFVCTGPKRSTSWLNGGFFEKALDSDGKLKVDSHLLVTGTKNVYAAGDITDLKEIKQGFLAEKHAQVVAKNIKKVIKNGDSKLNVYTPLAKPMGLVSLGRKEAVAQLPLGTFIGKFPGMIKSKDLFVGKTRKALGLKQ